MEVSQQGKRSTVEKLKLFVQDRTFDDLGPDEYNELNEYVSMLEAEEKRKEEAISVLLPTVWLSPSIEKALKLLQKAK